MPVIASFGVALVPALIHLALVEPLDEPMLGVAWPVTLATDVAVCYLAARLIFGSRTPLSRFAILLAIASRMPSGFVALALFSPNREPHWTAGLVILVLPYWLRDCASPPPRRARSGRTCSARARCRGSPSTGAACTPRWRWSPIVPFLPHAPRDPGFFVDASPDARDALSRFEVFWRYPAQVALFFFGLVNAGVTWERWSKGHGRCRWPSWSASPRPPSWRRACADRRASPAAPLGWRDLLAIGLQRGHRLERRAVLLHGVDPARPDPFGDQHGRPADGRALPLALLPRALGVGRFAR